MTKKHIPKTIASDFLGSWINGNYFTCPFYDLHYNSSDFLGSWINGNCCIGSYLRHFGLLLTSSEVELMETFSVSPLCKFVAITSDFLGSWINGNFVSSIARRMPRDGMLLTSSEVELMETGRCEISPVGMSVLLTSSEVELMETLFGLLRGRIQPPLLTSSEVELMETLASSRSVGNINNFWLPRKLN